MSLRIKRTFRLMLLISILCGAMFGAVANPTNFAPVTLAQDAIPPRPGSGGEQYYCPRTPEGCANLGCKTYEINQKVCSFYNINNSGECYERIFCFRR